MFQSNCCNDIGLGLWCFNNISVISGLSVLLVEETGVPRENHRPPTSHWQTLSHNVVSSTPCLSRIQTHNVSGDRHWLHDHDNLCNDMENFIMKINQHTSFEEFPFKMFVHKFLWQQDIWDEINMSPTIKLFHGEIHFKTSIAQHLPSIIVYYVKTRKRLHKP